MINHKFQRYQGSPQKGEIVYRSETTCVIRVEPISAASHPIFLWFVTTDKPENDDYYVFSDSAGTHWRIPRHENVQS